MARGEPACGLCRPQISSSSNNGRCDALPRSAATPAAPALRPQLARGTFDGDLPGVSPRAPAIHGDPGARVPAGRGRASAADFRARPESSTASPSVGAAWVLNSLLREAGIGLGLGVLGGMAWYASVTKRAAASRRW